MVINLAVLDRVNVRKEDNARNIGPYPNSDIFYAPPRTQSIRYSLTGFFPASLLPVLHWGSWANKTIFSELLFDATQYLMVLSGFWVRKLLCHNSGEKKLKNLLSSLKSNYTS